MFHFKISLQSLCNLSAIILRKNIANQGFMFFLLSAFYWHFFKKKLLQIKDLSSFSFLKRVFFKKFLSAF
jgi:hypothetical protein